MVNCCTYGTLGAKSAIITAARGIDGISSNEAQSLSSLIPSERGKTWSLDEVYYGDEDLGRKPITEFVNEVNKYEGLFETAKLIEGVVVNRSEHASGVFITNDNFNNYCSKMKTNDNIIVSQYSLYDAEKAGLLKYDFLTTKATTKIRLTLDMLIENDYIEPKDTLKETYYDNLHPHIMNYDTDEVWDTVAENRMMDLFQFSSPVAIKTVKQIKPKSLIELSQANSLMRLMQQKDAEESPTETYVRFKNDISQWYKEMDEYNVPKEDQEILEQVLLDYHGVAENQESLMILSQMKELANFSVGEAHKLRKSISKKDEKVYNSIKKKFYKACNNNNVNPNTRDYVWNVQIKRQKEYGFSILHSMAYSFIALQELVLFTQYPEIFWNTACLTVNAGAVDQSEDNKDEYSNKTTNYGKIAKAIGKMKQQGIDVGLPHINETKFGFSPNVETNEIVFGLKGVLGIGDDTAYDIIKNRPYTSLMDFYERMVLEKEEVELSTGTTQNRSIVSKTDTITLIKAGAFDKIEDKSRPNIMYDFLKMLYPDKDRLTMRNIDKIIDMGIAPTKLENSLRIYGFRSFIKDKSHFVDYCEGVKSRKWHIVDFIDEQGYEYSNNFFIDFFMHDMTEDEDYYYNDKGEIVVMVGGSSTFEKLYKEKTQDLRDWLDSDDCLDRYNRKIFERKWEKYAKGTMSKWEMDSVGFYHSNHELAHVDRERYFISSFNELDDVNEYTKEQLEQLPYSIYKGTKYPQYNLSRICGTVLDKDNTKHTISLLTPNGVVLVKYYGGQYNHYNKRISIYDAEHDKNTIIEKSWFKRGRKLLITGYRRGDQFKPKTYASSAFQHTTVLIEKIDGDGKLSLKTERTRV